MKPRILFFFSTAAILLATTIIVVLWAKGYQIDRETGKLEETGIILVKSYPDGARITLDGALKTATNATLTGVGPGLRAIKIEKDGYSVWEKRISVEPGLVTNISAVLIPLTPELKPLTSAGVRVLSLAPNRTQVAYLGENSGKSGVWLLSLTESPIISRFGKGPELLLADTGQERFSAGEEILWSPKENALLIKMNPRGYYLITLNHTGVSRIDPLDSAEAVLETWEEERSQEILKRVRTKELSPQLIKIATDSATQWSPDEDKFLYTQTDEAGATHYYIQNLSKVIGVGEAEEYQPLTVSAEAKQKVSWYTDSDHLLVADDQNRISLMGLDGTNSTQIYSGALASSLTFPNPDGTRIIIQTSFNVNENAEANLYAIVLR